jgi:hypothetical protein
MQTSKYKVINQNGRELNAFCERNKSEILNGNFGSDIWGEFTFISMIGSSVTDYALMVVGLLDRCKDFRIGDEILSSHLPLLITLRDEAKMQMKTTNRRGHTIINYI